MSEEQAPQSGFTLHQTIAFSPFQLSEARLSLTSISADGKQVIKIELKRDAAKLNDLQQEFRIMRHLNRKGCVSCPVAYESGTVGKTELWPFLDDAQRQAAAEAGNECFNYLLQEYIPFGAHVLLGDMLLAYLEQKSLGVYHGDANPMNVRFNEQTGVCYLIDYDQAEFLSDEVIGMDNLAFLDWCNQKAREKYDFPMFMNFKNFDFEKDVLPLFRDGAFDLGKTTLYQRQQTTLAAGGIYHKIDFKSLFADGERDIKARTDLLDSVSFAPKEKVLDIGCNAGLLAIYLHDRGCNVTGVELDPSIVTAARIIANILGKRIRYYNLDLDQAQIPGEFDTIILFSVIHHTQNMEINMRKIANSCSRFLIECRLHEEGAKPQGDTWVKTSVWDFATLEEMVGYFEQVFPGFKLSNNLAQVDRARYILEFVKQ